MAERAEAGSHGRPESSAVWPPLGALVRLELGCPSCWKLGLPAGHGDRQPGEGVVVMGLGDMVTERGRPRRLESGASLFGLDTAVRTGSLCITGGSGWASGQGPWPDPWGCCGPTVPMGKLRHTGFHPCLRPSQSKEVVELGQKLKT